MSTLSSAMNARVVQTYQKQHSHSCPPYPLQQCGFSRAEANLKTIFIFANPPLQPGDQVAMDRLTPLPISHADPHYYLSGQATAQPAAISTPVVQENGKSKKGYTPDTFKSPDEIWRITRSLC